MAKADRATITIDESLDDILTLATDQNILDTITIEVDEDAKTITICGDKDLRYKHTSFNLDIGSPVKSVGIEGGFAIDFTVPTVTEFALSVRGAVAGDITFDRLDSFNLDIDGASSLALHGRSANCTAVINGASDIEAYDFITENASITLRGSSSYQAHATKVLTAKIEGVGSITYVGDPATVNTDIRGLGTITPKSNE